MKKIIFIIAAAVLLGCSAGTDSADTKKVAGTDSVDSKKVAAKAVSSNVYTRLVAIYGEATNAVKAASTMEELDSINNALVEKQDAEKYNSAKEELEIRNKRIDDPEAYQADIDAEKKAWGEYEDAYVSKLLELRN